MLPEGSRAHNHVQHILNNVARLGGGPAADGQANNGHDTESAATATPSTSAAPVSTPTHGLRATTSPSTSVGRGHGRPATANPSIGAPRGRGRPGTASPSTSAPRGRGQPATVSPRTSAATGRGLRATTPPVVTTSSLLAPISHTSPQPEVHPPIPDASSQPEVLSPTPPSQPSFDLGINFHLTPLIHPETPSNPPTSSNAPTMPIDPPTSSSSDPLGPPVGIDTV